ncbi:MAG: hypothetical protein UU53_C0004G0001, partial [Candidatus Curtissbacteria bacterium GW2011_GWC2_41_21]
SLNLLLQMHIAYPYCQHCKTDDNCDNNNDAVNIAEIMREFHNSKVKS